MKFCRRYTKKMEETNSMAFMPSQSAMPHASAPRGHPIRRRKRRFALEQKPKSMSQRKAHPSTHLHEQRQMTLRPDPLHFFPLSRTDARPRLRWHRILRHCLHAEFCSAEGLHEARKHEPSFVVCELLTEADARASVEGKENEGVWS